MKRTAKGILGGVFRKGALSSVGEIRLPSDIRRVVVTNIENLRENALDIFAKEISKVLAKLDIQNVVDDVLKNYTLRVEARVDLLPKGAGAKPKAGKKGKK